MPPSEGMVRNGLSGKKLSSCELAAKVKIARIKLLLVMTFIFLLSLACDYSAISSKHYSQSGCLYFGYFTSTDQEFEAANRRAEEPTFPRYQ